MVSILVIRYTVLSVAVRSSVKSANFYSNNKDKVPMIFNDVYTCMHRFTDVVVSTTTVTAPDTAAEDSTTTQTPTESGMLGYSLVSLTKNINII